MKAILTAVALFTCLAGYSQAQKTQGTVYGTKPTPTQTIDATKIVSFMGTKISITADVRGKVLKVTKEKGGWFDMDAGNGKIITARFSNYNINIPASLKGKTIVAEGVLEKQFNAAEMQHLAGSNKEHGSTTDTKSKLIMSVKGLMLE